MSSSPLASAGVEGTTTLRPGVCTAHDSSSSLCCAPKPMPAPADVRMTIGTVVWPPDM